MKIVHVTYSNSGGAGAAAVRIHVGLMQSGIDSKMLVVQQVRYDVPNTFLLKESILCMIKRSVGVLLSPFRTKAQKVYRNLGQLFTNYEAYSLPWSDNRIEDHPIVLDADVIHLHWVGGMINYETFFRKVKKPIIWTLHDMNPFLAGFHYEFDLLQGIPHQLQKLEEEILQVKNDSLKQLESLTIISPSLWMFKKASESELLSKDNHIHLPNGLNSEHFEIRSDLKSENNVVIGFAAEALSNPRKGYSILLDYLRSEKRDLKVKFVCAGDVSENNRCEGVEYVGRIQSEAEMARFYQKLDAFMICSREDNLPNVIVESLFCGVPVLGFKNSGMVEMIEDRVNGFLVNRADTDGIVELVELFKKQEFDANAISKSAKSTYSLEKYIVRYKEEVLGLHLRH